MRGRLPCCSAGILIAGIACLVVGVVGRPSPAVAQQETGANPRRLLVVYRDRGPHALEACAEDLFRRDLSMAARSADRSDSLDRWHARHRVVAVRALFRRADGTALARQRSRLMDRLSAPTMPAGRTPTVGRPTARSADATRRAMRIAARASTLAHAYAIELPAEADGATALAELRADPHVAFAQPDHAYALDYAPDDPYLVSQGSWGQDFADLWGLDRIGARAAWQTTRGAGQVVAVVDTGLDYTHPDIAANVWINPGEDLDGNGAVDEGDWNGIDDDGNGLVDDLRGYDFTDFGSPLPDGTTSQGDPDPFDPLGHGTHVAGTIAAVGDNGIGIIGVAPEARVMALKGFDDEGNGRDSDLWAAVLYAIENGAGVVNASWSCSPPCPDNPIAREVLAVAAEAGVVFVTSAGNASDDVVRNEPERTTAAITVGSLGEDDALSVFSNRGWLMDLIAPGGGPSEGGGVRVGARNILSLAARALPPIEEPFRVGDAYYRVAGTSMASPHVAGAVALLRAQRPELAVDDVRRLLRIASRDLGAEGHDPVNGGGALDLPRLLATPLPDLALGFVTPAPGSLHAPRSGPLAIRVRARGSDAVHFTLERAPGLTGAEFELLDAWSGEAAGAYAGTGDSDGGATGDGGVDRTIAWDASDVEPGPQVLRLRATLASGETVDEHTIVGLEQITPRRLSNGTFHEIRPDVSDRRVAWEALRDVLPRVGEIVVGGFSDDVDDEGGVAEPVTLEQDAEASRADPRIDGRSLVWREDVQGEAFERLVGCLMPGKTSGVKPGVPSAARAEARTQGRDEARCWPVILASAPPPPIAPIAFERGVALWSDWSRDRNLLGCRWPWPRACVARALGSDEPAVTSRLLAFDGETVLWKPSGANAPIEFCRLTGHALLCEPKVVSTRSNLTARTESAGLDGDLLAIEIFDLANSRVAHCRLDLATGTCDLRFVAGVRNARSPDVSERRIVWIESPPEEDPSIAYCERDPFDTSCRRVRLTGAPFAADAPRLDGHRLVFEDERFGPTQVLGYELPGLSLQQERLRLVPGMSAAVPIERLGATKGLPWQYVVEGVEGIPPAELAARIIDRGGPTAKLLVETPSGSSAPAPGQRGVWRIRATTPDGLETRVGFEVEIGIKGGAPAVSGAKRTDPVAARRSP